MINQAEAVHPASERTPSAIDRFLERYFSRITTGGAYCPEIDGLRRIAIRAVFFGHLAFYLIIKRFGEDWVATSDQGWMAADILYQLGLRAVLLFFVISGFVLGLPFAKVGKEGAAGSIAEAVSDAADHAVGAALHFLHANSGSCSRFS